MDQNKNTTMSVQERLAQLEALLKESEQRAASSEERASAALKALAAKGAGQARHRWYVANDGQRAGEAPKGCSQDEAKQYCKGTISLSGFNARFPVSGYREQWLALLDGMPVDTDAKAPFLARFHAYLQSHECAQHYAVKAASERKAARSVQ